MQLPLRNLARSSAAIVRPWLLGIALLLAGCGSSPDVPPDAGSPDAGPKVCAIGELTRDDGTCQPPGLPPDMACPPGELPLEDGTCQKAGVPPSACGVGFLPDGKEGCEPILPADPCPVGQMAVPGDAACHEVAPCGSGTWGDIPVEADTQFVDQAYVGGNSDGTQAHPWTTIHKGVVFAAKGGIVAVAAGKYVEDVLIQGKPVRLWGRCPAMVEIAGAGVQPGTIAVLQKAAGGAEIHGIAVTGAKAGIGVVGATAVVIERVWIHKTGNYGLDIQDDLGPTTVVLKGSLIEQIHAAGVFVSGSDATIEATVVRSDLPDMQGGGHPGIYVTNSPDTKERAKVTVRSCLVEQNHEAGVLVSGSDATIEATVVRANLPNAQGKLGYGIGIARDLKTKGRANVTVRACLVEQNHWVGVAVLSSDATIEDTVVRSTLLNALGETGDGIAIQDDPTTKGRANVTIRACLVEQNHEAGVHIQGSDATIEATVVRSTLSNGQGRFGVGIDIRDNSTTKERANVTIRACLIEQNQAAGVFVVGSDATIDATVIRSTLPNAQENFGHGVAIVDDAATKERANVTLRACLVEQNHEAGVLVGGSDATIEATVVRSTLFNAQEEAASGIYIGYDPATKERANVTVRACLAEQNHGIGVFVLRSDATIEAITVRDTMPSGDNTLGDGIVVQEGNATLQNVEVTRNARAGVSNFGGQVVITRSLLTCNAFDLDGEPTNNIPFSFDGSTDWQCSRPLPAVCTELTSDCHVVTTGIEAPKEPPPLDPLKP